MINRRNAIFYLVLYVGMLSGTAYSRPRLVYIEPQLLRLFRSSGSLEFEARMENSTFRSSEDGVEYIRESLVLSPRIDLGFGGSIYHPNLISFSAGVGIGYIYDDDIMKTSGTGDPDRDLSSDGDGNSYSLGVTILKDKPVNAFMTAGKSVAQRNYDFFRRVRVETERITSGVNLNNDLVPVIFWSEHSEELTDDVYLDRLQIRDLYKVVARNRRHNGNTEFRYSFNDNSSEERGGSFYSSERHELTLNDDSAISDNRKLISRFLLSDTKRSTDDAGLLTFQGREQLDTKHTQNVDSRLMYSMGLNSGTDSKSLSHDFKSELKHRLYKSLNSRVSAYYRRSDSERNDTDWSFVQTGARLTEAYKKEIGESTRLRLSASIGRQYGDYDAPASGGLQIDNDRVRLSDDEVTFLDRAGGDIAAVRVTDSSGTVIYKEGRDYILVERGDRVEIQRIFGGTIPNDSIVLASYDADSDGSSVYTLDRQDYHAHLSLFKGHLSLTGRYLSEDPSSLSIRRQERKTVSSFDAVARAGILRCGVSYKNRESNILSYSSVRTFGQLVYRAFSLNANQSVTDYPEIDDKTTSRSLTGTMNTRINKYLSVSMQGGLREEESGTYEREMAVFSSQLLFAMGRLNCRFGYQFQDELFNDELRTSQMFSFYAKRDF